MEAKCWDFLPPLNNQDKNRVLRKPTSIFKQPIHKHVRFEKSTFETIKRNVNCEFAESGTVFGYTLENAMTIEEIGKSNEFNVIVN